MKFTEAQLEAAIIELLSEREKVKVRWSQTGRYTGSAVPFGVGEFCLVGIDWFVLLGKIGKDWKRLVKWLTWIEKPSKQKPRGI